MIKDANKRSSEILVDILAFLPEYGREVEALYSLGIVPRDYIPINHRGKFKASSNLGSAFAWTADKESGIIWHRVFSKLEREDI